MKEGAGMRVIAVLLLSLVLLGCAADQVRKVDSDAVTPSDQQIERNLKNDPWACPYCGAMGSETARDFATGKMGVYVCTYKCMNGHTWKKDCL